MSDIMLLPCTVKDCPCLARHRHSEDRHDNKGIPTCWMCDPRQRVARVYPNERNYGSYYQGP